MPFSPETVDPVCCILEKITLTGHKLRPLIFISLVMACFFGSCARVASASDVAEQEPNDTFGTPQQIPVSAFDLPSPTDAFGNAPTATVSGVISDTADVDFYEFTIQSSQLIHADIDSTPTNTDLLLALFDESGSLVAISDDSCPKDAGSATLLDPFIGVLEVQNAGAYKLAVIPNPRRPLAVSQTLLGFRALVRPDRGIGGEEVTEALPDVNLTAEQGESSGQYQLHLAITDPPQVPALGGQSLIGSFLRVFIVLIGIWILLSLRRLRAHRKQGRGFLILILSIAALIVVAGSARSAFASCNIIIIMEGATLEIVDGYMQDLEDSLRDCLNEDPPIIRRYGWQDVAAVKEYLSSLPPECKVILIGHSWGGDSVRQVAEQMPTLDIELMILLDPVDRSGVFWGSMCIGLAQQGVTTPCGAITHLPTLLRQKLNHSALEKDELPNVTDTLAIVQRNSFIKGYSIPGKTVECEGCGHMDIFKNLEVLLMICQKIKDVLGIIDLSCSTLPDGSSCSDGIGCTQGDICSVGICVPGAPDDSVCNVGSDPGNDPDPDCKWNSCNPIDPSADAFGCVADAANELHGSPCEDGWTCSTADYCYQGHAICAFGASTADHLWCNPTALWYKYDPDPDCYWSPCDPSYSGAPDEHGCATNSHAEDQDSPCNQGGINGCCWAYMRQCVWCS